MSSQHMKKHPIKVIKKRARVSRAVPAVLVAPSQKVTEINALDDRDELATTVERWIGERRENRRVESVFSDDQLATWKLAPDTSK